MSLSEQFAQAVDQPNSRGTQLTVALEGMESEDREALLEALEAGQLSAPKISDILHRNGHTVSSYVIKEARRKPGYLEQLRNLYS